MLRFISNSVPRKPVKIPDPIFNQFNSLRNPATSHCFSSTSVKAKSDEYTLQVGKKGEERLNILNELYNPHSQKFLERCRISDRENILDIACGTGEMSCWMAQQTKGKVLAVDISEEQIEIGRKKAEYLGLKNIEFKKLSVFEIDKLASSFDLIYSRFLFVHIQRSEEALKLMYNCLSKDGVIASEEATASVSFCYPKSEPFEKWLSLWGALRKENGTDIDVGLKLPDIFRSIGCVDVKTDLVQPTLKTAKEKKVLMLNVMETSESAVKIGFDTKEGMEDLVDKLNVLTKQDHLIGYVRNSQVCGRKA